MCVSNILAFDIFEFIFKFNNVIIFPFVYGVSIFDSQEELYVQHRAPGARFYISAQTLIG